MAKTNSKLQFHQQNFSTSLLKLSAQLQKHTQDSILLIFVIVFKSWQWIVYLQLEGKVKISSNPKCLLVLCDKKAEVLHVLCKNDSPPLCVLGRKNFSQFDISNFSHSFPILHSMSSDSRIKTFSFQLYSKTYGRYLLLCLCRMDGLWKTFEPRDQHRYSFERQVSLTKSKEVEIVCQVSEKRVIWIRLKLHGFPLTFSLEQSPNFPYSDVKKLKSITHKQLQQNIYNSKNSFVPLIHFFPSFFSLDQTNDFFPKLV